MNKLDFFKWFIEAVFRITRKSPTFFVYSTWAGMIIFIVVTAVHFLHIKLPESLEWLGDGFTAGFGAGVSTASALTVDRTRVPEDTVEKKMPVTNKNN